MMYGEFRTLGRHWNPSISINQRSRFFDLKENFLGKKLEQKRENVQKVGGYGWVQIRVVESDFKKSNKSRIPKSF